MIICNITFSVAKTAYVSFATIFSSARSSICSSTTDCPLTSSFSDILWHTGINSCRTIARYSSALDKHTGFLPKIEK